MPLMTGATPNGSSRFCRRTPGKWVSRLRKKSEQMTGLLGLLKSDTSICFWRRNNRLPKGRKKKRVNMIGCRIRLSVCVLPRIAATPAAITSPAIDSHSKLGIICSLCSSVKVVESVWGTSCAGASFLKHLSVPMFDPLESFRISPVILQPSVNDNTAFAFFWMCCLYRRNLLSCLLWF